ncbi:hypothetical protein ACP70R_039166 [Stipagrostis hirtigluma subsp. patula]
MMLVTKTDKPAADEGQATGPTAMHSDLAALKNARSSVPVESDELCDILRMPQLVQDGNAVLAQLL